MADSLLKKTEPHIEGGIETLFDAYAPDSEKWRFAEVVRVLGGGENGGEFRVPAADTGREIFFNNRELLSRFTAMCDPDQEAFLVAIRAAMEKEEVDTIKLEVQWGLKTKRVIIISKINSDGNLNMYL